MIGIQGKDAILSFYKNDWLPFVCSSDITIGITANKVAIRAPGDGPWKKYTYQDVEYTLTLSGILQFDDNNFTGWDMLNNQLGFMHVQFRCSFDDENGDVKSVQGFAMIETSNLSSSVGALVKNDFNLVGSGKLILFDGFDPCPTAINTITVTGQTASDGIIHVTYTYSGGLYQIKYRLDGEGEYVYALADVQLDIPGLSVGNHFIEIVPVCINGFEGTGLIQDFAVTQSLTCSSVITSIVITTGAGASATNTHTGAATQMKYRIDGGAWVYASITSSISLAGLSVGNHTMEEIPVCANNVEGSGMVQPFTISASPSQSATHYDFTNGTVGRTSIIMSIFVNGVLTVSDNSTQSGDIVVPVGATVKVQIIARTFVPLGSISAFLSVKDDTTNTVLSNQSNSGVGVTLTYMYTATADNYTITESAS